MLANKILIIEDEAIIAEHLKILLKSLGFHYFETAHNKEDGLLKLNSFNPDLVLLDIRMKNELDGLEIAHSINENNKVPFIFITAHSDAKIIDKAIETKPAAYITKPFKNPDVFAAINIAIKNITNIPNPTFSFKDGYDEVFIDVNTILFVKSDKNYIDIICESSKYSLRNSLEWFSQSIESDKFMRIHRSYVVNISKISKLTSNFVEISQNQIPVSRKYLADLRMRLKEN